MLAKAATDVEEAVAERGPASFEYKLDAIRIQVHKRANEVRIYSRTLNEITAELPTVRDISIRMDMSGCILDGEAIVLGADGRPVRFEETMNGLGGGIPCFFDILHLAALSL